MLKNLGKLKYLTKEKELKINLNELKSGINFFESFIIYHDISDIKIYDRKCDHAGGKIISKDGNAVVRPKSIDNIIYDFLERYIVVYIVNLGFLCNDFVIKDFSFF